MSICRFSGESGMFACTAVENLFLQEFMPNAPGDYVKVYLYGLMQCCYPAMAEPSLEKFAHSLGMSTAEVKKAFSYWSKKGLLCEDKKGNVQYLNVRSALFGGKMAAESDQLYEHAELANRLAEVSKGRNFAPNEYELIYDMVDSGRFDEEAVVLLVGDAIQQYGKKLTQTRLKALIKEWTQKNLHTDARARQEILGQGLRRSPANKILAQLGIGGRTVTEGEQQLYEKWTGEWGFSHAAIVEAQREMTSARNPNFKYLDRVLESKREQGEYTSEAIKDAKIEREELNKQVRAVLKRLGIVGVVTEEQRRMYRTWQTQYGLSDDAILTIAKDQSTRAGASFKTLEAAMQSFAMQGLTTPEGILQARQKRDQAAAVLRAAGIMADPNVRETERINGWLEAMPLNVVMLAAQYARDAKRPIGYLTRMLDDWQQRGIRTVEQGEEQYEKFAEKAMGAPTLSALHHSGENVIQEGDLSYLVDTLDD